MKLLSSGSSEGNIAAIVARTSSFICLSNFLLAVDVADPGLVAPVLTLSDSSVSVLCFNNSIQFYHQVSICFSSFTY